MLNYSPADPGLYFALEDDTLLKVGPTHVSSSAPNSGAQGFVGYAKGEQWLDTSAGNALKTWDGTSWLAASFALSGDSLVNDGIGVRLNENSTDFATFPRNSLGNGYNLSGNIGFGTNSPTHRVSVNGGLRLLDQVDYPAGNLGAVAVVGGAFIFHNGSTWVNILSTNNPWEAVGNDVFYDQGDVLIGTGSPGSPEITLTSSGAGVFRGGGSFGNDVTVGGDGISTPGVISQSAGSVSINRADANACLELRQSGTVNTSLASNGDATLAGQLNLPGLPTYADEAAAVTGGLVTGDVYKTATGELRIKL